MRLLIEITPQTRALIIQQEPRTLEDRTFVEIKGQWFINLGLDTAISLHAAAEDGETPDDTIQRLILQGNPQ